MIPLGTAKRFSSRGWHRGVSAAVQRGWHLEAQMVREDSLLFTPHDMAQAPRSFSKQDGAFPSYLNLVENLSALTLLLKCLSEGMQAANHNRRGALGVRREK